MRPRPARSHSRVLGLLLAAGLAVGCQSPRRPLVVDSDPPGALVLLDGVDTGFATPCLLNVSGRSVKSVELRLPGYEPAVRQLVNGEWSQMMLWRDMTVGTHTWRFPLFMSMEDATRPLEESDGEMPHRLHVRLERQAR